MLLQVNSCKQYLTGEYFTDIEFQGEQDGNFFFTAYDTDYDENATIQFEVTSETTVFVNVKYESDDQFSVYDKLIEE